MLCIKNRLYQSIDGEAGRRTKLPPLMVWQGLSMNRTAKVLGGGTVVQVWHSVSDPLLLEIGIALCLMITGHCQWRRAADRRSPLEDAPGTHSLTLPLPGPPLAGH